MEDFDMREKGSARAGECSVTARLCASVSARAKPRRDSCPVAERSAPVISCYDFGNTLDCLKNPGDNRRNFFRVKLFAAHGAPAGGAAGRESPVRKHQAIDSDSISALQKIREFRLQMTRADENDRAQIAGPVQRIRQGRKALIENIKCLI